VTLFTPAPFVSVLRPRVITFRGSDVDGASLSSYSFTGKAIGTASDDRLVVVGFGGGPTETLLSASIGGVGATVIESEITQTFKAYLVAAFVPTGTTADIDLVWTGALNRIGIAWWTITGLDNLTPIDTGKSVAGPPSDSINTIDDGAAVAYSVAATGSVTHVWTGVTERFDQTVESTTRHSGGDAATNGGSLTITATETGTTSDRAMVCASW
jgi:hypothetical protein